MTKPDTTRFLDKIAGLGLQDQADQLLDSVAALAAAGATPEQLEVFAQVAAIGTFRYDDIAELRRRGISLDRTVAEQIVGQSRLVRHEKRSEALQRAVEVAARQQVGKYDADIVLNIARAFEPYLAGTDDSTPTA
ncbi:hypothetical protein ACF044_10715 [Microbacterium sp. NPDC016588]